MRTRYGHSRARIRSFALGFGAGAVSWLICPWVSSHREPFDSGVCLILGQFLLVLVVGGTGWQLGFKHALLAVLGCYFGQLAYIFALGGESRAWLPLAAITVIPLCVIPVFIGGISSLLGRRLHGRTAAQQGDEVGR